jgi:hypothetical protein
MLSGCTTIKCLYRVYIRIYENSSMKTVHGDSLEYHLYN